MKQTPNAQRPTPNVELSAERATSNIELVAGRVRPNGGHRRSHVLWRIVDLIVGGIFIYAGVL
ncbi:MAG: hypothetical protein DME85_07330, partial [Verrucomicrobia bacterium]